MRTRWPLIAVIVVSLAGFFFASFSTSDFAEHLDRQVHSIHCSFVPGLAAEDASGSTGCHVTMMSPYSSVMRETFWGGIPVSLPAMSVFAFLTFFAAALLVLRREDDRRATLFLVLATSLPLVVSIAMGVISIVTLGAACKLCIGIYATSILSFVFAFIQWRKAAGARAAVPRPTAPGQAQVASNAPTM